MLEFTRHEWREIRWALDRQQTKVWNDMYTMLKVPLSKREDDWQGFYSKLEEKYYEYHDMKEAIEMMTSGRINPATMLTHIGGLNAVVDTTLNLPNIKGGKKLIYTQIELPLTAIADFEKLGESDPLFAKLAEITARHNGLWSPEAEKYLLQAKA